MDGGMNFKILDFPEALLTTASLIPENTFKVMEQELSK
jgi:hypothetical protein